MWVLLDVIATPNSLFRFVECLVKLCELISFYHYYRDQTEVAILKWIYKPNQMLRKYICNSKVIFNVFKCTLTSYFIIVVVNQKTRLSFVVPMFYAIQKFI